MWQSKLVFLAKKISDLNSESRWQNNIIEAGREKYEDEITPDLNLNIGDAENEVGGQRTEITLYVLYSARLMLKIVQLPK